MKNFIKLSDLTIEEIHQIFKIASDIELGGYSNGLRSQAIVLFFPETSIRTRVTFEKGIHMLGGQSILFPSETLDKKESTRDVIGYLNNWADCIVVRHPDLQLLCEMEKYAEIPIINGMTKVNHPCEILTDLYAFSKIKVNYLELSYTYVGPDGNIGRTWTEVSKVLGLNFMQCCPVGYEIDGVKIEHDVTRAISKTDIVLTDSLPAKVKADFAPYQITKALMQKANTGAFLNPCPPFTRGEEVSEDAIDSKYFVGYKFKKSLLPVQQAIMLFCMQ
jgi:ornithine carbamoyltransferase